jgi:hypothetical protein
MGAGLLRRGLQRSAQALLGASPIEKANISYEETLLFRISLAFLAPI